MEKLSDPTTQMCSRDGSFDLARGEFVAPGPTGGTRRIGKNFFHEYAGWEELVVVEAGFAGLIPAFAWQVARREQPRAADAGGKTVAVTAWVRELNATGKVIAMPGCKRRCVKVVFRCPTDGRSS